MKIGTVSIAAFRGVPGQLTVDFSGGGSTSPVSAIIVGDNGCGKSTIIDAIEFGLQAKLSGKHFGARALPSAFSFSCREDPRVEITLSNNIVVTRSAIKNIDGVILSDYLPQPEFSVSPFVLRRSDILKFVQTPDEQRQTVFLEYLKHHSETIADPKKERSSSEQQLMERAISLRRTKGELRAKLATELKLDVTQIPNDLDAFNLFVRNRIFLGVPKRQRGKASATLRGGITVDVRPAVNECIVAIRKTIEDLRLAQREYRTATKGPSIARESISVALREIGADLSEAFRRISTSDFVERIEMRVGDLSAMSLAIDVVLTNGEKCGPLQVFSEANLDLLACLTFLSILKKSEQFGQARVLVLDDVFQSIDATIRLATLRYILNTFRSWQIIITAHDRLWRSQICDAFRTAGIQFVEKEITRWAFDTGPHVRPTDSNIEAELRDAIGRGELVPICAAAGRTLEAVCDRLSWTLPISVTRRREDRYTLGDLWPGVAKTLKRTNLAPLIEALEGWIHLRNMVGAHYNEWSQSLSLSEATAFGNAVIGFISSTRCDGCGTWILPGHPSVKKWTCRCEILTVAEPTTRRDRTA